MKCIGIVGAGALGGYVGGTLAHRGHDVTLIDPWPENVETIRRRGLELDGVTPEEKLTARPKIRTSPRYRGSPRRLSTWPWWR
jgi:2-dehydropantoate 2-reductase